MINSLEMDRIFGRTFGKTSGIWVSFKAVYPTNLKSGPFLTFVWYRLQSVLRIRFILISVSWKPESGSDLK